MATPMKSNMGFDAFVAQNNMPSAREALRMAGFNQPRAPQPTPQAAPAPSNVTQGLMADVLAKQQLLGQQKAQQPSLGEILRGLLG